MRKKWWQFVIMIPVLIGVAFGVYVAVSKGFNISSDEKIENVFGKASYSKYAKITKFYTYGTNLGFEGYIEGIAEDNFEGIRVIVTDGDSYNKEYTVSYSFEDGKLTFKNDYINDFISLENFEDSSYYILVRLKLNNSKDHKFYLLSNASEYGNIEYYTLTKDGKNQKVEIKFDKQDYNENTYDYLGLNVSEITLPDDVYDFVIDAGHGRN